jgi:hypothetical protein
MKDRYMSVQFNRYPDGPPGVSAHYKPKYHPSTLPVENSLSTGSWASLGFQESGPKRSGEKVIKLDEIWSGATTFIGTHNVRIGVGL